MREREEDPEEQRLCSCKFSAISCSRPPSFLRSFLPCFLPSLSSQSSLEIGTGLPPSPSLSPSSCCTGTIIALRTVRARCGGGGFCCMHLQFSLSTPLPRSRNCRTNERPTFKEEDRNRSIGNLSKVYLPQAVKGTSTA